MAQNKIGNISIENAQIGFRNFSGKEGKYNAAGNRNFAIFLESDLAHQLEIDGWNVRWMTPKDPDDAPQAILQVKVGFGNYPPKIILISNGKKSEIYEDTCSILDWCEIDTVDLIIRPYPWEVSGKKGVKAYLKTMYIVLATDGFADKYDFTPDSAQDVVGGCGSCETCSGTCEFKEEHL